MTEDEWAAVKSRHLATISPLSAGSGCSRWLVSRSAGGGGDVVAAALEASERFADTGKTKAALEAGSRCPLRLAGVLANLASGPQDHATLGKYMALFVAGVACSEDGPGGPSGNRPPRGERQRECRDRSPAEGVPGLCEVAGPALGRVRPVVAHRHRGPARAWDVRGRGLLTDAHSGGRAPGRWV